MGVIDVLDIACRLMPKELHTFVSRWKGETVLRTLVDPLEKASHGHGTLSLFLGPQTMGNIQICR